MKILYIDMDGVLVDFQSGIDALSEEEKEIYKEHLDNVPGIFSQMKPVDGAIQGYKELTKYFDVYILSSGPWDNPSAWSDKLLWIKEHLGDLAYKKLIISSNKNLNIGDYLIDDRPNNGAKDFEGELIPFRSKDFPDSPFKNWNDILAYLLPK